MSRRDKRKKSSDDGGSGDWLTTYSDLVTLLLCFFVLLFSFSEIDAVKFRQISESLKIGFEGGTGVLQNNAPIEVDLDEPGGKDGDIDLDEDFLELYNQLEKYAKELDLDNEVAVEMEERGIVLRFKENVFFDSGSAEIKPESRKILDAAAAILNEKEFSKRHLKIEGHTDSDRIVYSKKYETNWELSSARATNVLRYLVEVDGLSPSRVSSAGYGEYRPIANNDNFKNKAKNRRVDMVILKDSFEKLEPEGVK